MTQVLINTLCQGRTIRLLTSEPHLRGSQRLQRKIKFPVSQGSEPHLDNFIPPIWRQLYQDHFPLTLNVCYTNCHTRLIAHCYITDTIDCWCEQRKASSSWSYMKWQNFANEQPFTWKCYIYINFQTLLSQNTQSGCFIGIHMHYNWMIDKAELYTNAILRGTISHCTNCVCPCKNPVNGWNLGKFKSHSHYVLHQILYNTLQGLPYCIYICFA
jgi:hypothetical protein